MLAGCYDQTEDRSTARIRPTTAQRHPIALQGRRAARVEVFIGSNRGGLTPGQRADVLAFAQAWRREATGGIVIDVPTRRTDRPARPPMSLREIHSILAAAGVPRQRVDVRHLPAVDARARHHQAQLPEAIARGRSVRPVAARSRPDRRIRLTPKTGRTGISAAPRSAISPPWSTTRPTWCSRAAKRRPIGAPHARCDRQISQGRKPVRRPIPIGYDKARSATSANDQARTASRSRRHRADAAAATDPPRPTSTSRRRRAFRCRPSARPWKPPPPCRRPAKTAAWPRRI